MIIVDKIHIKTDYMEIIYNKEYIKQVHKTSI